MIVRFLSTEGLSTVATTRCGSARWPWPTRGQVDLLIERAGELWPVEMKSGATFQPEWLRKLVTWQRHAAAARQGAALLISAAPGSGWHQGVMLAEWRDALATLAPPAR